MFKAAIKNHRDAASRAAGYGLLTICLVDKTGDGRK